MKGREFMTKSTVLATLILVVTAIISCKPKNKQKVDPKRTEASVEIKLAAYNVLFGNWGTPKQIGKMFKPYNLDIICFSEVPDGDWTAKVGKELDMDYTYVGKISSANHKDKFKSILSRTPLYNLHEIEINAVGWAPASMVGGETKIQGETVLVYSLHVPGRPSFSDTANGSASEFIANQVLPEIKNERFVIMGDFNNLIGDAPLNLLEQNGMQNIWNDLNINVQNWSTHQTIESGVESGVIDHIYYNTKIKAKVYDGGIIMDAYNPKEEDKSMTRFKVEWEKYGKPLSDHRPIWAAIRW